MVHATVAGRFPHRSSFHTMHVSPPYNWFFFNLLSALTGRLTQ